MLGGKESPIILDDQDSKPARSIQQHRSSSCTIATPLFRPSTPWQKQEQQSDAICSSSYWLTSQACTAIFFFSFFLSVSTSCFCPGLTQAGIDCLEVEIRSIYVKCSSRFKEEKTLLLMLLHKRRLLAENCFFFVFLFFLNLGL